MCLRQHECIEAVCVLDQELFVEFLLLFLGAEAPDVREEDAKGGRGLRAVLYLRFLSMKVFLTFGGPFCVSLELARRQNGLLSKTRSL